MRSPLLILNPNAEIVPLLKAGKQSGLRVSAPVKGVGRKTTEIDSAQLSQWPYSSLTEILAAESSLEVNEDLLPFLHDLGVLVLEHEVSETVSPCLRVPLDGEIDEVRVPDTRRSTLVLNNSLTFIESDPGLGHIRWATLPGSEWIQTVDPRTQIAWPLLCDADTALLLRRLLTGDTSISSLNKRDVNRLISSNILSQPTEALPANSLKSLYATNGFVVITDILPLIYRFWIKRYCAKLYDEGQLTIGDFQVPLRYISHNDPLMALIHRRFVNLVSDIVGRAVKPSYSYLASYRRGASLKRHIDREQCEFSGSLLVDFHAANGEPKFWPLRFEDGPLRQPAEVVQEPGDMVIYRGRELIHSRDPLVGDYSTSVFVHYVDHSFAGALD